MKKLKRYVIFYFIICILFFILEPILYFLNKWAKEYALGAEMAIGLFIPAIFLIFCFIGFSTILYGILLLKRYNWKSFIPFFIIIGVTLLYIILPKTEYSIWYKVIKFYF